MTFEQRPLFFSLKGGHWRQVWLYINVHAYYGLTVLASTFDCTISRQRSLSKMKKVVKQIMFFQVFWGAAGGITLAILWFIFVQVIKLKKILFTL
jgi:hypothetical protein